MTSENQPYLHVKNLSKAYGQMMAVHDVNLEVRKGEMVVLLGPSGCGKTTTLRLIAGFVEATSGSILLEGKDYAALQPYKRGMGMVFQSYALFPHLTVAQNVLFGLRMRKLPAADAKARLDETLDMVKLTAMADRLPRQLSGGQQQRVALARALAIRPKLLLLDEPLSNLDANLRQSVAREIRQLQRAQGLTALMVTHDQDEAMAMADRLVLMKDGNVQQVGTQEDLYERPANPFVARFIGHSNLVSGELSDGDRFETVGGNVIRLARRYPGHGQHTLALRPERLRSGGTELTANSSLRVEDSTYVGSHIEHLVAFGDGSTLCIREATGGLSPERPPRGDLIAVSWDVSAERLFDSRDAAVAPLGQGTAYATSSSVRDIMGAH